MALPLIHCAPPEGKKGNTNLNPTEVLAENTFNSMSAATEGSLSFYDLSGALLTGTQTLERFDYFDLSICRKTAAVVPNPTYTYSCYSYNKSQNESHTVYDSLPVSSTVSVDNSRSPLLPGTFFYERHSSDGQILCVYSGGTQAIDWYRCYQKL